MPSHYLNQCMLGYCQLDTEEQFSFKKMHLTISCAIRRSFCPWKWVNLDIDYSLGSHVISLLQHGWFKGRCVRLSDFHEIWHGVWHPLLEMTLCYVSFYSCYNTIWNQARVTILNVIWNVTVVTSHIITICGHLIIFPISFDLGIQCITYIYNYYLIYTHS